MKFTEAEAAALEKKYGPAIPKPVRANWPGPCPYCGVNQSDCCCGQGKRRKVYGKSHTPLHGPCQSIWIPGWAPALLNRVMHGHWANGAKLKKSDKQIVAFYFSQSGVSKATGPRRLSMLFVLAKGKRLFDRDAPWKSAKDALAACGALLDDTPALCVDGSVSYARALLECQAGTLLLLEDL